MERRGIYIEAERKREEERRYRSIERWKAVVISLTSAF